MTGKEVTLEEVMIEVDAPVEGAALEEVPVMNAPPCLEELVWAILQEVRKMHESMERCEHFKFRIWDELRTLVTLKGREVASAQANVMSTGVAQEKRPQWERSGCWGKVKGRLESWKKMKRLWFKSR